MLHNESYIKLIRCFDNRYEMIVNVHSINYIDREKRKIRIHMNTGIYSYTGKLKELQEKLPDNFIEIEKDIIFKTKRTGSSVIRDEILYVERRYNDIIMHTKENVYLCKGTLRKIETELSGDFFRIHNGYLINLKHIVYVTCKNVKMSNGDELPISNLKRMGFIRKLEPYML